MVSCDLLGRLLQMRARQMNRDQWYWNQEQEEWMVPSGGYSGSTALNEEEDEICFVISLKRK